jgi:nucleotide-binding universal stress UspA family protein
MNVRRILVPVDFSPGSQAAVDCALYFADAHDASIDLLHVYELPTQMSTIVPGANSRGDVAEERSDAGAQLVALAGRLLARGFTRVRTRIVGGFADQVILAEAHAYDLIVMGTHGRTGLDRLVVGSVAEQVVRGASCPVLTLHLPAERR